MFKLSIFAFLLSMITATAIAEHDNAAQILDPRPGLSNLINAGIDVPGIIDISVCKK